MLLNPSFSRLRDVDLCRHLGRCFITVGMAPDHRLCGLNQAQTGVGKTKTSLVKWGSACDYGHLIQNIEQVRYVSHLETCVRWIKEKKDGCLAAVTRYNDDSFPNKHLVDIIMLMIMYVQNIANKIHFFYYIGLKHCFPSWGAPGSTGDPILTVQRLWKY